ncbi:MAG: ATPase [Anaerovibrio sp.]|uniref:ATPase n=1 Tax=Anaerovibrio sp. TaxID=1872532 RepID=UPI0025E29B47|nr:ATPase [Anaerovibrio sp.]MCR5176717.1 ATPase [Anaerovibrio sp.]
MEIDNILEEIENLVAGSNRVPFVDKVMIDDVELFRLMDVLRSELPTQIQEACDIVKKRDEIVQAAKMEADRLVEGAKREADHTIEQAKAYAKKAVEQNEIVLQAKAQEKKIMDETMEAANKLKKDTEDYSNQLKASADNYANEVFNHVIENISGALNAVQQAKEQLNDNKQ